MAIKTWKYPIHNLTMKSHPNSLMKAKTMHKTIFKKVATSNVGFIFIEFKNSFEPVRAPITSPI